MWSLGLCTMMIGQTVAQKFRSKLTVKNMKFQFVVINLSSSALPKRVLVIHFRYSQSTRCLACCFLMNEKLFSYNSRHVRRFKAKRVEITPHSLVLWAYDVCSVRVAKEVIMWWNINRCLRVLAITVCLTELVFSNWRNDFLKMLR